MQNSNRHTLAAPAYHGLHSVRPAGWNYAHSNDRDVGCAANDQAQRLVSIFHMSPFQDYLQIDFAQRLPSPITSVPPTNNHHSEVKRALALRKRIANVAG